MPLNRYQIRNEYSLADPELYRAADKDDPEALLEGVAMAGLVGVLRQLGDLAEFAAEIFHDLHEEVMVTASRGHSLMVRVQQLEAEFPTIEKAFLSQTNHSSFFYNSAYMKLVPVDDLCGKFLYGTGVCTTSALRGCTTSVRIVPSGKIQPPLKAHVMHAPGAYKNFKHVYQFAHFQFGLDWHPNNHMDQNLITQGDLPRFVMDSYEECRGPPRLFLLDKFDVAGAGACLKRYSDPSFFKVEPSSFGITSKESQREKKARKAKKKGSRWRNGETPEALPTPHAKLHQLFLEERIENGISDPARRVKLKRRLNGFPFTNKSGKSYMEKFLKSPSPDHKEVHEIPVDPSTYGSAFEIAKISTGSPEKELDPTSRSVSPSPAKEEIIPHLFEDELNEVPSGTRDDVMLQTDPDFESYDLSDSGIEAYNIPSNLQMEDSEKEIPVDDGNKTDDSIYDYQSDDIASEIDNYLDALTTMESEMDTDSEFKIKNGLHNLNRKRESRGLGASDVKLQAHSSDSQSMGNSTLSDDGNSMSKKEISSISHSDTRSTAAENTPSDGEVSCNIFSSATETHETEIINSSLDSLPINKENTQYYPARRVVLGGLSAEVAKSPSHSSETGDQAASPSDSDPSCRNTEAFAQGSVKMVSETDKVVTDPSLNTPYIPSISEATEERDHDALQRLPCENQLMDESEGEDKDTHENLPSTSLPSVSSHSKDDFQLHLLAENKLVDELHDEDVNQDENVASMTNQDLNENGPPQINPENLSVLSPDDQPLDELHGDDLNLSKTALIAVSAESHPVKEVVDEYPSSSADGLSKMAAEKESGENSVDSVSESGTGKDICMLNSDDNQIGERNLGVLHTDMQPLDQTHSSDSESSDTVSNVDHGNEFAAEAVNVAHVQDLEMLVTDVQPLGQTHLEAEAGDTLPNVDDVNQSAAEDDCMTPKEDTSSELVEPLASEINAEAPSIMSSEEQMVYLDEPLDTGDGAEMNEAACNTNLSETDSSTEPLLLLVGNHVDSDERDSDSVTATVVSSGPDNNDVGNYDGSFDDVKTSQEACDSGPVGEVKGLKTEEACLLESPAQSGATEGLHQQIFSLQCFNSGFGHLLDDDQSMSESQMLNDVSGTHILEAKDNLEATPPQSSFKQNELEFSHTEDKVESPSYQDQPNVFEVNSEVITDLDQSRYEKCIDHVGPFSSSSNSVPIKLPSEPSATFFSLQGSNNINISEHLICPSSSISSSLSPLPDASQIYVDEMPPMPPLPPVQWRMTKFQHAPPGQESVSVQNNVSALPPLFPSKADQDTQPVNQLLLQSVSVDDNSHPGTSQFPSVAHHRDLVDGFLPAQGTQYRGILQLPGSDGEILQNSFQDEETENQKSRLNSSSNLSPADTASAYAPGLPHEFTKSLNQGPQETNLNEEVMQSISVAEENLVTSDITTIPSKTVCEQPEQSMPTSAYAFGLSNKKLKPLDQETPETSTKEVELRSSFGHVEEILVSSDNNSVSALTENVQPKHVISTSEGTLISEESNPTGLRSMKLPRPRNPIIDAVAAHDKSKLRKVTDRARPQIQKEEERDSLLEQIRTRSFNLKPAVVTRPSIPGPTTNLKVAAILEKAKTIRQAFAGSDEDDDDSWSDS